jgi:hypothetical protein
MTTRKDLAQIAVRLLAIYLLIQAMGYSLQTFFFAFQQVNMYLRNQMWQEAIFGLIGMMPLVCVLLLCGFLWRFSNTIANKIVAPMDQAHHDEGVLQIRADELLNVGLLLMGTWLWVSMLFDALPWLAGTLFYRMSPEQWEQVFKYQSLNQGSTLIAKLILGTVLIFKARGVANLLIKLRDFGLKKPADSNESITPHQGPPARSDG